MEDHPFIEERGGDLYVEAEDDPGRFVGLEQIFELYADPDMAAGEVADLFSIQESDVRNAVFYWTEEPGVYEELIESSNLGPDAEIFETESDDIQDQDGALGRSKISDPSNPIHAAGNAFLGLRDNPETGISEEDIKDNPDENYFGEEFMEVHIDWTENDSDLGVYVGWDGSSDSGVLAQSVDGESGETLYVDNEEMVDWVQQVYNDAFMRLL